MLRIEVDIFSGRPNPVWMISDRTETDRLLKVIAEAKGAIAKQGVGFMGLGFRELRVDLIADDEPRLRGLTRQFALGSTAAKEFKESVALARRIIKAMPLRSEIKLVQHDLTPLDARLRDGLLERQPAPFETLHHLAELLDDLLVPLLVRDFGFRGFGHRGPLYSV